MKDELQDLLKEVLGKWREKGADPSTLCTNLWFGDHISNDEYDIINSKTSRSDKFLVSSLRSFLLHSLFQKETTFCL